MKQSIKSFLIIAVFLFVSCSEDTNTRLAVSEIIEKEFKKNPNWKDYNYTVLEANYSTMVAEERQRRQILGLEIEEGPLVDKGQFLPCAYWEGKTDASGKQLRGTCDSQLSLQSGNIEYYIDKKYKLDFSNDKLFIFDAKDSETGKGLGGMVTSDDDTFACSSCDDYMKFNFYIHNDKLIYLTVFHKTHWYASYFKMNNFDESVAIFENLLNNIQKRKNDEQNSFSFIEWLDDKLGFL